MIPCSQDYLNALRAPIKEVYIKFEFYDYQMNYINEFTKQITENDLGSISVSSDRFVQRNFSFTLFNEQNEFTFSENSLVWIDKHVKLFLGLKLRNGIIEYVPQGVYCVTEISDSHTASGKYTKISAQDKGWKMVDKRGKFKNRLTLETGANIGESIKTLAGKVGETMFNFDSTYITIPYTIIYEPDNSIGDAISELALLARCTVGYDVFGFLRLKNIDLDEFDKIAPSWSYVYGDPNERFYAGNVRKMDESDLANHIVVYGGSSETVTSSYELIVTESNPLFQDSPYSIEKIGDIIYFHNNGNPDPLLDADSCKYRAKYSLMQKLGYSEKLSLSISPNFLHDVNDVIQIEDVENNVSGKYLLKNFSIPLKPDLMSCECLKHRKVIESWDFI